MINLRTGSNRIRNRAAILAAAGMLWIGSTQVLPAQTAATVAVAEDTQDDRACSLASVAGEWAYTETGTVIPATVAVPFAAVARYTLDANGNLSGSATSSSGGTVSNVTLKGIGTVNSDCTGTLTVGVYALGTLVRTVDFDLVYVDHGREGRAIVTSLVLANGTAVPAVLTVDARKLFHGMRREQ
jgi:hypothetical protein